MVTHPSSWTASTAAKLHNNAGAPVFAGLGRGNALWVAILEKAFAFFRGSWAWKTSRGLLDLLRPEVGTYNAIEKGWPDETFKLMGMSSVKSYVPVFQSGKSILESIDKDLAKGYALALSTPSAIPAGCPCIAKHVYMIDRVNFEIINGQFVPVSVTLRNPWGVDGVDQDDGNRFDGYVTLTASQVRALMPTISRAVA